MFILQFKMFNFRMIFYRKLCVKAGYFEQGLNIKKCNVLLQCFICLSHVQPYKILVLHLIWSTNDIGKEAEEHHVLIGKILPLFKSSVMLPWIAKLKCSFHLSDLYCFIYLMQGPSFCHFDCCPLVLTSLDQFVFYSTIL